MTRLIDLSVGDVVTGTVDSVVPFGAFVRITDDAHGLLHGSHRPKIGTAVTVRILDVDEKRKRASLELA